MKLPCCTKLTFQTIPCKRKICPCLGHEGTRREWMYVLSLCNLGFRRTCVENRTPRLFKLAKYTGNHLTGGWLGARAIGRVPGKLLALASLEPHLPRSVAYTHYPAHCTCFIHTVIQKLNQWLSCRTRHSRVSNPKARVYL